MLDWLYALFPTSNVSKHVVVQMNITKFAVVTYWLRIVYY